MSSPFFSIITVTYNAEKYVVDTLDSILLQERNLFELIIIDGVSKDSTLSLIEKHAVEVDRLISEKDDGIYDAMNKGISLAKGKYIVFMNAGDKFYDKNTLLSTFNALNKSDVDLYAGGALVLYSNGKTREKKSRPIHANCLYTPVCHQSLYSKLDCLKKHPFNLRYKIAADFNFMLSVVADKGRIMVSEQVLSIVSAGGVSDVNRINVWSEYERIVTAKNGKSMLRWCYYRYMQAFEIMKRTINSIVLRSE